MDGADALRFRKVLPDATVLAFEANPRNQTLMQLDDRLNRQRIEVFPFAVSDSEGESPFFVVDANYSPGRDRSRRGIGSLYPRFEDAHLAEVAQVHTVRLDDFLHSRRSFETPLALWVDVEGKAFEAISGAKGVLSSTKLLHVEVETEPLIDPAQKTFKELDDLLLSRGFRLVAVEQRWDIPQFNALYIDTASLHDRKTSIRFWIGLLRTRYWLARFVWRLLPSRARFLWLRIRYRP
jgi:FkbM family methyltransferase